MKYLYSGPTSGVTLQDGDETKEVMLHTGGEVLLPEEHEYTKTLLALGHLTLVPQEPAPVRSAGTKQAKEG